MTGRNNLNKSDKVCVAGLGTIGYPTACYISNQGFPVFGYDIDKKKTLKIDLFNASSEWSEVPRCEVYVLCVNTGWENGKPDMSNLFDVCQKISGGRNNPLVCIESTVTVGTCRELVGLFDRVHMVYIPHRYWSGNPDEYGVNQIRVMGALNEASLAKGKEFYEALKIPLYTVSSLEVAEIVKTAENAYRFVQIAFVEQLKLLCEERRIPFKEVRDGANTKWNVSLLEARKGIRGKCLPKDIRYLASIGYAPLLQGAIEADRNYIEYMKKLNSSSIKS